MPRTPDTTPTDFATLRLEGTVTRESLAAACRALAAQGPHARLLVDLRAVAAPRPDSARVLLACHLIVYFWDSKLALLSSKQLINGVTESVAVQAGMQVQQFWREEAARAWLLAD